MPLLGHERQYGRQKTDRCGCKEEQEDDCRGKSVHLMGSLLVREFWCGLTPELRRTALRPCVSEDHSGLHEAAKRSRLERIVSALKPAVVAGRDGSLVWRGAKKCCTGRRHIGFEICRRQGESLSGKLLMALPTTALCKDLVLLRANA